MAAVEIRVTVDARAQIESMRGLERHIPYLLARSLSQTAVGAQTAVRTKLPGQFHLRNTWTVRGIRYKAAQKKDSTVQAVVYTDTENRKTHAPDYLGRQETGGMRVPHEGRMHIAVPMPALWALLGGRGAIIPTEMRPRNLLVGSQFGRYADFRNKRNKYSGEMERQMRLRPVKMVRGWAFWEATARNGAIYIFGRDTNAKSHDIHPMYKLVPEVEVHARLGMDATVRRYVDEHFAEEWETLWSDMLARGIRI